MIYLFLTNTLVNSTKALHLLKYTLILLNFKLDRKHFKM